MKEMNKQKVLPDSFRLFFRNYTEDDFDWLYKILSDPETTKHYPKPYDEEGTRRWIRWNLDNYEEYGFGLWAIGLKENGKMVGDCGITMQKIDGESLPEIGYHLDKTYFRQGLGKEAAKAVRDWLFTNTKFNEVYSYMNKDNIPSSATAETIGMEKIKEYTGDDGIVYCVYMISRSRWEFLCAEKDRINERIRTDIILNCFHC